MAGSTPARGSIPKYGMRLTELTRPETVDLAASVLNKAGYDKLGSGHFASVFMKPGANYVLKLFNAQDAAYLAYMALARANPNNPHFPKLGARTVRVTDNYYAVKMEPLNGIQIKDRPALEAIWWYMYYQTKIENPKRAEEYMANHPVLKQACDLISGLLPKYQLDLGIPNFMRRGDTVVFIDPVWTGKFLNKH